MLVWKKILWLRDRIKDQKAWIDRCGGDLAGYIANYGDPGVPPLRYQSALIDRCVGDLAGKLTPLTLKLTAEQQKLFPEGYLTPVPGLPDTFYKPHSGDGGTAIYNADYGRLRIWQQELSDLEIRCFGAKQKADEMQGKVKVRE